MRILIMGLPGSGKTTLAKSLSAQLNATHINADEVRTLYNDWDFSTEGRVRQSHRMRDLATKSTTKYTVVDFVCPTKETRKLFDSDFVIWMDTIAAGRFEDTNKIFESPVNEFNLRLTSFDYDIQKIAELITDCN